MRDARITHRSLYGTLPIEQIILGRLISDTLNRVETTICGSLMNTHINWIGVEIIEFL